jgi:hypothetical protein
MKEAEMRPNGYAQLLLAVAALAACSCGGTTANDVDASGVGSDAAVDADADALLQDSCSGTPPTCDAAYDCPCTWGEAVASPPDPQAHCGGLYQCGDLNVFDPPICNPEYGVSCYYPSDGGGLIARYSAYGGQCLGPSDFQGPSDYCVPLPSPDAGAD